MTRGESTLYEQVHLVLHRNGLPEDAWFTWSNSPIHDESGGVGGLLNTCREDTAAVRAESARRTGEDRLRALATTSGAVLYQVSADWSEVQPLDGKGLIPSTDRPTRDWMGRNIPASEHAAVREHIGHCIATKTPFEMEHRVNRPDGSVGWTHSRAVPVFDGAARWSNGSARPRTSLTASRPRRRCERASGGDGWHSTRPNWGRGKWTPPQ
jgi:PAS domain-containing protein